LLQELAIELNSGKKFAVKGFADAAKRFPLKYITLVYHTWRKCSLAQTLIIPNGSSCSLHKKKLNSFCRSRHYAFTSFPQYQQPARYFII